MVALSQNYTLQDHLTPYNAIINPQLAYTTAGTRMSVDREWRPKQNSLEFSAKDSQ